MHNRVLKKVDKNKRNCINFSLYGDLKKKKRKKKKKKRETKNIIPGNY